MPTRSLSRHSAWRPYDFNVTVLGRPEVSVRRTPCGCRRSILEPTPEVGAGLCLADIVDTRNVIVDIADLVARHDFTLDPQGHDWS